MKENKDIVRDHLKQWLGDTSQAEVYHGIKFSNEEFAEELWVDCQELDIINEVADKIISEPEMGIIETYNFISSFQIPLEIVDDDVYEEHRAEIEACMNELEEYRASLPKLRES